MIDLHETLSEFSYGYGVTREVESLFASLGMNAAPFLPSLLHEADLGFDVAFARRGRPLLLQFKLGQELSRLRTHCVPKPSVDRPFWRYRINTSHNQFKNLLNAERLKAEVYYVSPQFSDWGSYEAHYLNSAVLDNSFLVSPKQIKASIGKLGGVHQVIYDRTRRFICSETRELPTIKPRDMAAKLAAKIDQDTFTLRDVVISLAQRIRRTTTVKRDVRPLREEWSEIDDAAALVGLDSWSRGAQLFFVTRSP